MILKNQFLPNYYSVLPANVRYCPDLTYFEIVLYSEITALSNALGYCYASNSYFARLYRKDSPTISKAIAKLVDLGFLTLQIDQEAGNVRKIYLGSKKDNTPIVVADNSPIVIGDNHNITSINTNLNQTRMRDEENISVLFDRVFKGPRKRPQND